MGGSPASTVVGRGLWGMIAAPAMETSARTALTARRGRLARCRGRELRETFDLRRLAAAVVGVGLLTLLVGSMKGVGLMPLAKAAAGDTALGAPWPSVPNGWLWSEPTEAGLEWLMMREPLAAAPPGSLQDDGQNPAHATGHVQRGQSVAEVLAGGAWSDPRGLAASQAWGLRLLGRDLVRSGFYGHSGLAFGLANWYTAMASNPSAPDQAILPLRQPIDFPIRFATVTPVDWTRVTQEAIQQVAEYASPLIDPSTPTVNVFLVSRSHEDIISYDQGGPGDYEKKLRLALSMLDQYPDFRWTTEQAWLLYAYWVAHPEDHQRITDYVRSGRIEIMSPWLLFYGAQEHAEDLIRNIALGQEWVRRTFGVNSDVLCRSDSTDQPDQLAQIAAQLGIRNVFLQYRDDQVEKPSVAHSEFIWRGRDGSEILVHRQMDWYLGIGRDNLEAMDKTSVYSLIYGWIKKLEPAAATPNIDLPVGGDLVGPHPALPEIVHQWNKEMFPRTGYRLIMATPSMFLAAVRAAAGVDLVSSSDPGNSLAESANVLSRSGLEVTTVADMGQPWWIGGFPEGPLIESWQRWAESLLTEAESWSAFASLSGMEYPLEPLKRAWELLVRMYKHDGIEGSAPSYMRAGQVVGLAGWVRQRALAHIAATVAGTNRDNGRATTTAQIGRVAQVSSIPLATDEPRSDTYPYLVFNPLGWARTDLVTVNLRLPPGSLPVDRVVVIDRVSGKEVPAQIVTETIGERQIGLSSWLPLTEPWTGAAALPQAAGTSESTSTFGSAAASDSALGSTFGSAASELASGSVSGAASGLASGSASSLGTRTEAREAHIVEVLFVAHEVPAFGYRPYDLIPVFSSEATAQPAAASAEVGRSTAAARVPMLLPADGTWDGIWESSKYRVTFQPEKGGAFSVWDKSLRESVVNDGGRIVELVEPFVGGEQGIYPRMPSTVRAVRSARVEIVEDGPVRTQVRIEADGFGGGEREVGTDSQGSEGAASPTPEYVSICTFVTLYRDLDRIELQTQLIPKDPLPNADGLLHTYLVEVPLVSVTNRSTWDGSWTWAHATPYGYVSRTPNPHPYDLTNFFVSREAADLSNGNWGVALLDRGAQVMRASSRLTLNLCLYRFGKDTWYPTPYPNQTEYAIYPHPGNWSQGAVYREALAYNHPLVAVPVSRWAATPTMGSLACVLPAASDCESRPGAPAVARDAAADVLLTLAQRPMLGVGSGLQKAGSSSPATPVLFRLVETGGRAETVRLRLDRPFIEAAKVDLQGRPAGTVGVSRNDEANSVQVSLRPWEIATVAVWFADGAAATP